MAKRVLIVEDEILVALDMEDALVDAGYEIVGIAADRREALSMASHADVALVDLNLRDGPTGIGIGMELSGTFGVHVLFLTANPASITTAVTGTVGCLGKPCPPAEICAAIDFAIERQTRAAPAALNLFS